MPSKKRHEEDTYQFGSNKISIALVPDKPTTPRNFTLLVCTLSLLSEFFVSVLTAKTYNLVHGKINMLCTGRISGKTNSRLRPANELVYLGCPVTIKNYVRMEIKLKFTLANRWYYGLSWQLSSRYLSRETKL